MREYVCVCVRVFSWGCFLSANPSVTGIQQVEIQHMECGFTDECGGFESKQSRPECAQVQWNFLNTFFKDDFWQYSAAGVKFKVTPVNHLDRWLMVNMQAAAVNMSV